MISQPTGQFVSLTEVSRNDALKLPSQSGCFRQASICPNRAEYVLDDYGAMMTEPLSSSESLSSVLIRRT